MRDHIAFIILIIQRSIWCQIDLAIVAQHLANRQMLRYDRQIHLATNQHSAVQRVQVWGQRESNRPGLELASGRRLGSR